MVEDICRNTLYIFVIITNNIFTKIKQRTVENVYFFWRNAKSFEVSLKNSFSFYS